MKPEPTGEPHVDSSEPDPAHGSDMSAYQRELVDEILGMYRDGWFPMADPRTGQIDWYKPKVRGVIPLDPERFHVPQTLARRVRSGVFEIRFDTAFREVITACSQPRRDEGESWINQTIIELYCLLHRERVAHSVEAWRRDVRDGRMKLVGGLYGLHVGGAFFGESMFSRPPEGGTDASKVCLVHLVERLRGNGFELLDAQLWNEHLAQFGCMQVPEEDFGPMLASALALDRVW